MVDSSDLAGQQRRRPSGAPTIYDIAERAGVNPSTVSRALNQPGRLNAATEARIRAVAAALNFHANPMARALPTGRTHTLALVVADITNPVVFGIIRGAERAAAEAGYTLVIAESQESGEVEAATIERVAQSVDGLVLATTRMADVDITRIAARKPVVLINRATDGVPHVAPSVEPGVDALVEHLVSLGHRHIAFLPGPTASWTSARRQDALVSACQRRAVRVGVLEASTPTIAGGEAALPAITDSTATAVVGFNDLMAMGVVQAARAAGIHVPAQLSVAGFDDIFGSALMVPGLTTVRADLAQAGERAVMTVLRNIGVSHEAGGEEELVTSLVVRQSTGPAPV
jgi:LacI family transcriptional regulator